ncbi:MAG: restriction endonuclease [Burkholderiaceae bacterium]|nr:restriction endonuclease [Burkholderiaceae bacterium]
MVKKAATPEPDPENGDGETDDGEDQENGALDDVALHPGPNADSAVDIERYITADVRALYDVFSYRHAAAILANEFPAELKEIEGALLAFRITTKDIGAPGGNESIVPKKYSSMLRPLKWYEARIQGDLIVRQTLHARSLRAGGKSKKSEVAGADQRMIENFIDGHKIDYVKGRVAFDLEWNSKDQTFDRDLYAFRTFHECGLISAGVMVTRSASLNPVFDQVPLLNKNGEPVLDESGAVTPAKRKYGASTTWMGKLLYRLNAGRHGGCPVLVFGITPRLIEDWNP